MTNNSKDISVQLLKSVSFRDNSFSDFQECLTYHFAFLSGKFHHTVISDMQSKYHHGTGCGDTLAHENCQNMAKISTFLHSIHAGLHRIPEA